MYAQGKKSGLICTPELRKIELYNEDQFLILACDGLWDVLSPQKAVDFVLANVQHYRKSVINKMKQMKQMRRSKMMEKEKAETGDEKNIHDNKNELDDGDNDDNDGGNTKAPACGAVDDTGFDEKNIKIEVDWNQIARNLVNYAYKKGSTDNITALIVSFTDVNNY